MKPQQTTEKWKPHFVVKIQKGIILKHEKFRRFFWPQTFFKMENRNTCLCDIQLGHKVESLKVDLSWSANLSISEFERRKNVDVSVNLWLSCGIRLRSKVDLESTNLLKISVSKLVISSLGVRWFLDLQTSQMREKEV